MTREIEIKLRLDPKEIESFAALEALSGGQPERKRLRRIYFDDANHRVTDTGFELRVRSFGSSHVQTIKAGRSPIRGEWEARVSGETPQRNLTRGAPAWKLLKKGARPRPIFIVDMERRSWRVVRGDSVAVVSVDHGEITADGCRQPIAEAEIELKAGQPQSLFELARTAIHCCDASPSFVGKALRGHRILQGATEKPERAIDLELKPGTLTIVAFRQICLSAAGLAECRNPAASFW